jgi:hypothetical protein
MRKKARELGVVSDESADKMSKIENTLGEINQQTSARMANLIANYGAEVKDLANVVMGLVTSIASATGELIKFTKWLGESIAAKIHGVAADDLPRLEARLSEVTARLEEMRQARQDSIVGVKTDQEKQLEKEAEQLRTLIRLERERRAAANDPTGGSDKGVASIQREIDRQREFLDQSPPDTSGGGSADGVTSQASYRFQGVRSAVPSQMTQVDKEMRQARQWWKDYHNEMRSNQGEVSRAAQDTGRAFSSAFMDAARNGEDLRGTLRGLAEDLQGIILRQTITKPLGNAVASSVGSMFGGGGGAGSGGVAGSVPMSADGNVFTGPSMTTVSERGHPEAVMPLERQGGKLGVRASGGGGANVEVNIINQSSSQVETEEREGPDGKRVIEATITDVVDRNIAQGKHDKSLGARFGARPRTRGR